MPDTPPTPTPRHVCDEPTNAYFDAIVTWRNEPLSYGDAPVISKAALKALTYDGVRDHLSIIVSQAMAALAQHGFVNITIQITEQPDE